MTTELPSEPLRPLTPVFNEDEHGIYLGYLRSALSDTSGSAPLNIALTGTYGSGKSSVLRELSQDLGDQEVVTVSLPAFRRQDTKVTNSSQTDEIQKEIVKQLLYREKPSKLSESRFRRVQRRGLGSTMAVAASVSFIILLIAFATHAGDRFEQLTDRSAVAVTILWLSAFVLLTVLIALGQSFVLGRFHVAALSTGPAHIVADKSDQSYFDQYLDEIVYFFSATRCSVAIFEDLDRFETLTIFEELRELNVLLNSSRQIGRPIRFVYALRDSVFEDIGVLDGRDSRTSGLDAASARAKFFDLVIPIVPFATRRTAIDLWDTEVGDRGISQEALSIAATHVQDMRVIKTVVNEYDVFLNRIKTNKLEHLRPDSLFALMLYKAVHLEDYEQIRGGQSQFDLIERGRRDLISLNARRFDAALLSAIGGELSRAELENQAQSAGEALREGLALSMRVAGRAITRLTFTVGGASFTQEGALDLDFWQALEAADFDLQFATGSYSASLNSADVEAFLGDLMLLEWSPTAVDSKASEVLLKERRADILTAEASDLLTMSDVELPPSFETLRGALHLDDASPLARELVENRLVDRNFSLYVSRFYGGIVTASAMNYVLHVVQPGVLDIHAPVGEDHDVEGVLLEAGSRMLDTRSALNVDIVNALITDQRFDPILRQLTAGGDDVDSFLDAYLIDGRHKPLLLEKLAPRSANALQIALSPMPNHVDLAASLVDTVLLNLSKEVDQIVPGSFATFVDERATELSAFQTEPSSENRALILRLLGRARLRASSLADFAQGWHEHLVREGLYRPSAANFAAAARVIGSWGLEDSYAFGKATLLRVVDDIPAYLNALPTGQHPFSNPSQAAPVLNYLLHALGPENESAMHPLLARATKSIRDMNLEGVASILWPAFLANRTMTESAKTVFEYIKAHGIDDVLAARISRKQEVTKVDDLDQPLRLEVAHAVLAARSIAPTKRVRFVGRLKLSPALDVASLPKVEGDIFGYLLRARLISDSPTVFEAVRQKGWAARLAYMRSSRSFASYAAQIDYPIGELARIFGETTIPASIKNALIAGISDGSVEMSAGSADAIARDLTLRRPNLPAGFLAELAEGKCSAAIMARLLSIYSLSDQALLEVLRNLPTRWSMLAERGRDKPWLPETPGLVELLERLRGLGTVSSWRTEGHGLRISRRH